MMRKKIITAIGIVCLIFILGGIYIITAIEVATAKLDHLIVLHQVELLREKLLTQIKEVQTDLTRRNTSYAGSIDTVIANARRLKEMSDHCFDCHHSEDVLKRLHHLTRIIEQYKYSLSRLLTMTANLVIR